MPTIKKPASSEKKSISINGDVKDSAIFIGDNNTIIQKFFNIFKSNSETLEHRNRRILLGHVENAWIKGVLDASLHGAALLDLGIKQDPEADYADLNAKLSFEGAIEVQRLTQKQITEFFDRFGDEMAGIKQVLKKDRSLRESNQINRFSASYNIQYSVTG